MVDCFHLILRKKYGGDIQVFVVSCEAPFFHEPAYLLVLLLTFLRGLLVISFIS